MTAEDGTVRILVTGGCEGKKLSTFCGSLGIHGYKICYFRILTKKFQSPIAYEKLMGAMQSLTFVRANFSLFDQCALPSSDTLLQKFEKVCIFP